MIPNQWFIYHSKLTCLSYLRYLTLATCRYHHPDWPIYVYDIKDDFDWGEGVDEISYNFKDYTKEAREVLRCEFREWTPEDPIVKQMPPQNQSDIFSLAILKESGGWYTDTDVLFLKPHEHLGRQDYAFCGFGGLYYHVGMFGSKPNGWVVSSIVETAVKNYDAGSYNSTGTYAILKSHASDENWLRQFNAGDPTGGRNYSLPDWTWVSVLPQHHDMILKPDFQVDSNALALHLYGSMPSFGQLNQKLSPETIMDESNNDIVSRTVRKYARDKKELFLVR